MYVQCANVWQKVHIEIWHVLKGKRWSTLGHWASIHWKKPIFVSLFVPSYNGYLECKSKFQCSQYITKFHMKGDKSGKKLDQWQMFSNKSCLICLSGWFHSSKVPLHPTVSVFNKGPVCEFNCPEHPELMHQPCHSPPGPTICCPSWSPCRLEESTLTVYDSVSEYQAGAA